MVLPVSPAASRWPPSALFCAVALTLLATPVRAGEEPDLNRLVVEWATGHYASPVMCEIEGEVIRGIRRLRIEPERRHGRDIVASLEFKDMDVEHATRCFDALGRTLPNIVGKLALRVPGRSRPDTAMRDFRALMKRGRDLELHIVSGAIRVQPVGSEPQTMELRGGRAYLRHLPPASDAAKQLSEFESPRKLLLELDAKDGWQLSLPLFQVPRPRH